MATTFWSTNHGKALRAVLYVLVSGLVTYLTGLAKDNPAAFGAYTAVVNGVLVYTRQFVSQ